jgi:hypothetical protein
MWGITLHHSTHCNILNIIASTKHVWYYILSQVVVPQLQNLIVPCVCRPVFVMCSLPILSVEEAKRFQVTKIESTLDKNLERVIWHDVKVCSDQIASLASWRSFESAKKNQKWAKAIITKRWAKVPIPIMRQQFTACLTWLQYGFLNHNSATEALSQSFWEDVGNQLLILSPHSL